MPQMSPMNWMYVSVLFLSIYMFAKMNLNFNFKSETVKKKISLMKNFSYKW